MSIIGIYFLTLLAAMLLIGFVGPNNKGRVAVIGILIMSVISCIPAVQALMGSAYQQSFCGKFTGLINVEVDALSAWFMVVISFTMVTSALYGQQYMQAYKERVAELSLHWINFLLVHAGLISICAMRNTIAFLFAWEIMALSSFVLVIFEGDKRRTLKAGINYLIQSHIGVALLTVAFVWVAVSTGTYDFSGIIKFANEHSNITNFWLMVLFFVGFGFKAGFVPFHTWLPHAHPAAPSHVSGMMSGVLIKIGIYGIMRMLLLINCNYLFIGYLILGVSIITGLYGVMLATLQRNLKKLLAYSSVENIGIIGIGIGLGCLGIGYSNGALAMMGFAGALLHTLNHSLFKSMLFYGAGNIYQATHTMDVEHFGGLIKKMPQTAFLFLLASIAICGLPPFNGFVSEFVIYNGLFSGINAGFTESISILTLVLIMAGLALIGGFAVMCFTKAFGITFLGEPRTHFHTEPCEFGWAKLLPMYISGLMIVAIGLFPQVFVTAMSGALKTMVNPYLAGIVVADQASTFAPEVSLAPTLAIANQIGWYMMAFIVLALLVYGVRCLFTKQLPESTGATWGCGYLAPTPRIQYTANSFVRTYRRLAKSILQVNKRRVELEGIFPTQSSYSTDVSDRLETKFILSPLRKIRYALNRLSFLQNGRLQYYILYGLLFVVLVLGVPFICYLVRLFVNYLNSVL